MSEQTIIIVLFSLLVTIIVIFLAVVLILLRSIKKTEEIRTVLKSEMDEKQNQLLNANLTLSANMNDIKASVAKDFIGFVQSMNTNLDSISDATYNHMAAMERRIADNIQKNNDVSKKIYSSINEKMVHLDETQKGLNELSKEIFSLQSVLTDKKSRGIFGEIDLYSLLESSFGNDERFYRRQYKLDNGNIADAVIFGPPSAPIICVDSKFPLENYRRIYDENLDVSSRNEAKKQFKRDVLKHIDDIKKKYIIPGITADVAYMFIPAEAVFSEIISSYPDIVDISYNAHVYLVSPTTLMAYITAIKSIYLNQKRDNSAKEIRELLNELSVEFKRYRERCEILEKDYKKLIADFDSLGITGNKILSKFERIKDGETNDVH